MTAITQMLDISKMTNEELLREYQNLNNQNISDVSQMSDEELLNEYQNLQIRPQTNEAAMQLFNQLGGKMPSGEPLAKPQMIQESLGPIEVQPDLVEIRRRQAYKQLIDLGYKPEEIGLGIAYHQALKPPSKLPQGVGATIASLGVLGLGQIPPFTALPEELVTMPAAARAVTAITAAGLGGAAGRGVQLYADPDEDFNFTEVAKAFGEEAAYEMLGAGVGKMAGKLFGGVRRSQVVPEAQRLSQKLEAAGERAGIEGQFPFQKPGLLKRAMGVGQKKAGLLPAEFSENKVVDVVQSIGESSYLDDVIFQFKRGRVKAEKQLESDLLDRFVSSADRKTPQELGGIVYDTIKGNRSAFRKMVGKIYNSLDETAYTYRTQLGFPLNVKNNPVKKLLTEFGEDVPSDIKAIVNTLDDTSTFSAAHKARSELLSINRKAMSKLAPDPQRARFASMLAQKINEGMEAMAKEAPNEFYNQWKRADALWRGGAERFDNDLIRKLLPKLKNQPEIIAKAVFQPDKPSMILRVRKTLDKETFNKLRTSWLSDILEDSASKKIGEQNQLMGETFLKKFNGMGDDTLKAMGWTVDDLKEIRDLGTITALTRKQTLSGLGKPLQYMQGAGLVTLAATPLMPAAKTASNLAAITIIGPKVLARMMVGPKTRRLLMEGFKINAATPQGVALTSRLIREVLNTRKEINKEEALDAARKEFEGRKPSPTPYPGM